MQSSDGTVYYNEKSGDRWLSPLCLPAFNGNYGTLIPDVKWLLVKLGVGKKIGQLSKVKLEEKQVSLRAS